MMAEKEGFNAAEYLDSLQTVHIDPKTHSKNIVMLEDVLEGLFDKPLADLPKGKRKYAEPPYFPHLWDTLDAKGRLIVAVQLDRQSNSVLKPLWEKLENVQSEIAEYGQSEATTALNITEKNQQLVRLRKEEIRLDILLFGPLNEALVAAKEIGEAISELHNDQNDTQKLGQRAKRVSVIVETAKAFEYDLQSIPYGGKKKIKDKCLDNARLFTDSTFEKAWQEAKRRKLIEVVNVETYRRGG